DSERWPAVLPRAAGGIVGVQDDEAGFGLEALTGQGPRGAQPGLTRADHDDIDGWVAHAGGTCAAGRRLPTRPPAAHCRLSCSRRWTVRGRRALPPPRLLCPSGLRRSCPRGWLRRAANQ